MHREMTCPPEAGTALSALSAFFQGYKRDDVFSFVLSILGFVTILFPPMKISVIHLLLHSISRTVPPFAFELNRSTHYYYVAPKD